MALKSILDVQVTRNYHFDRFILQSLRDGGKIMGRLYPMLISMSATTKASIRSQLRDHTAGLHQQAEDAFESYAPIDTSAGLSNFLTCMYQAHLRFGGECDDACRMAGLEVRSDKILNSLRIDLGLPDSTRPEPQPLDKHFSLGVGYVFEGSAFGAGVIKKRLNVVRLSTPIYLDVVTDAANDRWTRYVELLNSFETIDNLLPGAVKTFEFLIEQAECGK